jgi:hypothetical protein
LILACSRWAHACGSWPLITSACLTTPEIHPFTILCLGGLGLFKGSVLELKFLNFETQLLSLVACRLASRWLHERELFHSLLLLSLRLRLHNRGRDCGPSLHGVCPKTETSVGCRGCLLVYRLDVLVSARTIPVCCRAVRRHRLTVRSRTWEIGVILRRSACVSR